MQNTYIYNTTKRDGTSEHRAVRALSKEAAEKRMATKANREGFTYSFNQIAIASI